MAAPVLRYIKQRYLSKCLNARRNNPPETTVAAKKAWRRSNKKDIRKACYKQQQGLCAYTELWLDDNGLGYHLEHIAPRSSHPELTFVPHNIILSILDDVQSGALSQHEKFGGHHKSEEYSDDWFISPFNRHCADFFKYQITGEVTASAKLSIEEQEKANKTIAILNLNAEYLMKRRKTSLQLLSKNIEALRVERACLDSKLDALNTPESGQQTDESLEQLAKTTLEPIDRKLPEFYSAKKQLFERYGLSPPLPL